MEWTCSGSEGFVDQRRDLLSAGERGEIMARQRVRHLPVTTDAGRAKRHLPLAPNARPLDRELRPIYAVWEVTLACDLACRHCGSRAGKGRPDELTPDEALDLIAQMAKLGVREVTMIGGEAYLRDDFLALVAAIRAHGMTATMTTGGRGVTPVLARNAAAAGLQAVSVSIDGLSDVHDRLRGLRGSFELAMSALAHLRTAGIRVTVNTQINRLSLIQLPTLLERIAAAGAKAWQIQMTVPMGRASDEPDVLLQPYDMLTIFPLLAQLQARADALGVRIMAGNNVGYFGPHEATLRSYQPDKHSGSCSAGRLTLGIEGNGAIKGCPSLPTANWTGGNIRDASLQDIWERAAPLRYTRDRTVADLWGYCAECYYADTCRAGCTWTSDAFFGRPGNNPYCHHRALEFERRGLRERLVRVETAPGLPFDQGRFELHVEPDPATKEPS